jgi:hypothetical protein
MSTNSRISIKLKDQSKKSIYCHWDGYPDNQLPILKDHYNTDEKVEELIALGSISYLAKRVKPEPGESHSFDNPAKGVIVAYHRDRGEELSKGCDRQSYNYIWNGESWGME